MPLTADEKRALGELQKSINAMRRHVDSIDPATSFPEKLEAREALRKLIDLQAEMQKSAMDRDLKFNPGELDEIEKIGEAIRDAAKKQQRIKFALKMFKKLVLK